MLWNPHQAITAQSRLSHATSSPLCHGLRRTALTVHGSKVVFVPVRQYADEVRPGRPTPYETPTTILLLLA